MSLCKMSDSREGRGKHVWPHGYNWNNLGKGPLEFICRISKAYAFYSFKQDYFSKFLAVWVYVKQVIPSGWAIFDPKAIIWTILFEARKINLQTKY